ncbi:MAG TPA: HAMP domain-containing protein [Vulgatibacter sp.]|nr:HAMP domain-containing protein [Vulgatibacter sp.]
MDRTDDAAGPAGAAGRWRRIFRGGDGPEEDGGGIDLHAVRDALRAAAQGDFAVRLPVDGGADGAMAEVCMAFNALLARNEALVAELDRIRKSVGTQQRTDRRMSLGAASGGWTIAVDSVNEILDRLIAPMARVSRTLERVAAGELSRALLAAADARPARSEVRRLEAATDAVIAELSTFADGISDLLHQFGLEGRLGLRVDPDDLRGVWRALIGDFNRTSDRVTSQIRSISEVARAIVHGDFSRKVEVEATGEVLVLKDSLNDAVEKLRGISTELIRVAREVGVEGKLGAQAPVPNLSGTWRELVDGVNFLASNLTSQVRNISQISTAIANGDLSQKITVEARGEVLNLKDTINEMVDRLRTFAGEVTRVAREVGTEGKLGGQAVVPGVAGTWRELTDSVNTMASNLTSQVRGIAKVVNAVAEGDLSRRLVLEARGEIAALADTINGMTDTLRVFADQVTTVAREVGIEGLLGGQARVPGAAGTWKDLTDSVNMLAGNLTAQVRNIALVTTAVANGDLSKKITVEAKGEVEEVKETVNAMMERLRTFSSEVTRVAREVGTQGQLGGQAVVPGVSGTWKDLTDHVNVMAANLTDQVRGIGRVVTAVANGDLTQRLFLIARGEIATLVDTINGMTDTLRTFAEQVTTVAREVGVDGKLGGQARVPGASGTWRALTDNVNHLAARLTTQVRAISDVAKAVTEGDLSRTITVEASGEVLALKDTINQMIANLRDTTAANEEQDWLKSNLARFFAIMQGQRSLETLINEIMSTLTPAVGASQGAFYLFNDSTGDFQLAATYAHMRRHDLANRFVFGQGLVGQCALERKPIVVERVPEEYVRIESGLGEAPAREIAVFPVIYGDKVKGVIELASFQPLTPIRLALLDQISMNIGLSINMIKTSRTTEQLLEQLQGSNAELEDRRRELEEKAELLEQRNREIAEASRSLEAKAEELTRVSEYKSQFLANMSHEIRTPLNSMLILAQMLAADEDSNLTEEQREWAATIHAAGRDLLVLINQVLDLSRVEAGRVESRVGRSSLDDVQALVERTFRPLALQKKLELEVARDPEVPAEILTDRQLLDQILLNLMSNALKFTERGRVALHVEFAPEGKRYETAALRRAEKVLAFRVKDTGIGIPRDQQEEIFEAFRQADGSPTRRYEGTGLGLAISREFARVLGGELDVKSRPGEGSTFTLYLPFLPAAEQEDEEAPHAIEGPARPAKGGPGRRALPEGVERLAGRTALVVEDDVRNLYAITALLERLKMDVVPATSAPAAYEELRERPLVDVVLVDLMMPDVDGYQAIEAIRKMPEVAGVPIVVLTAKTSKADRRRALDVGADDLLLKPLEIDRLASAILRVLGGKQDDGASDHA